MATMRDIAQRAQVSIATVSNVINATAYVTPRLRQRVLRAIRELHYQPNALARTLRTKRSKTVGMIIPNISDPFFDTIVRGAEDVLVNEGYTLIVGNSDNDVRKEESYYNTFRAKRVDGILLIISPAARPPEYLDYHDPGQMPIVYLDRYFRGLRGDTVQLDDVGGSYLAVSHMLEAGHKRVAIITGPLELLNASMRLEGYRRALADHGLAVEHELIREGRFDMESGEEQAKWLLRMTHRPTGLFVSNALMSVGALRAFAQCGVRCPEEISLVSYNDLEWFDLLRPSITAVKHPVYDLGAKAAEILLKRFSGRLAGSFRRITLKYQLVVRESSRPSAPKPAALGV